jgi:hypothetical protein
MAETPVIPEGDATRRHDAGELDEAAVLEYAGEGRLADATTALALMARLPIRLAERIFTELQDDLLLIVAKSLGFRWETVAVLQALKVRPAGQSVSLPKLKASFDSLSPMTAKRVVRFLHARDSLSGDKKDTVIAGVTPLSPAASRLHA